MRASFLSMRSFFSCPLFFINSEQESASSENVGLSFKGQQIEIIYYSLKACCSQESVVAGRDLGH